MHTIFPEPGSCNDKIRGRVTAQFQALPIAKFTLDTAYLHDVFLELLSNFGLQLDGLTSDNVSICVRFDDSTVCSFKRSCGNLLPFSNVTTKLSNKSWLVV